MKMHVIAHRLIVVASLLLGTLISLAPPIQTITLAATDPTSGCLGSKRANQGQYGVLIIDCSPGFATAHDRVYVYPRTPFPAGQDWHASLNTTDAVWVFDAGARREASLIIDFHPNWSGPGLVADLYDDRDGDGNVRYAIDDGIPVPAESTFPTVRIVATDGWWTRGAAVNFNLNITVDGTVDAAFGSDAYINRLKTDGRPDFKVNVRDPDHDGRPDFEWIDAWPDAPDGWGILRTQLMVNTNHDEAPIENSIFWPYLGTSYQPAQGLQNAGRARFALTPNPGASYGFIKDYGKSFPPIQVWWPGGEIAYVGEFVASRGNGSNWFVYSVNRLGQGQTDLPNFENPFAFYDLARARDGYPDLAIRQEYYPPRDPYFDGGQFDQPSELIRYSWDQFHAHAWNYKLDLLGRHPITSAVAVGPLSIVTVPYSQYPTWITSQRWDAADFVAAESDVWTSEGIYPDVLDSTTLWTSYLTGVSSELPTPDLKSIPKGYRGEFTRSVGDRPLLYFSPIDHRLHLLGAATGIWNVDDRTKIRYDNLGGDYLNKWTLVENGSEARSLTFVSNQLLLVDHTGVRIKSIDASPASFTTLPPANHEQWAQLGASLVRQAAPFPGDDLQAMFDQFSGPTQFLPGSTIKDLRATPDGFRFAMHLSSIQGTTARWAIAPAPGDYLIRYRGATGYSAARLEPVKLEMSSVATEPDSAAALQPLGLTVTLTNRGNEDASAVAVNFLATHQRIKEEVIGSTSVDVPGEGSAQARVRWTPPAGGDWSVRAVASAPFVAAGATHVTVAAAPASDLGHLLTVERPGNRTELVIGCLPVIALLVAGGLAFAVLLVPTPSSVSRPPRTNRG